MNDERSLNRPTILGWNQFVERPLRGQEDTTECHPGAAAFRLIRPTTISGFLGRRSSDPHTVLQKIMDDILIVERRTEDQSRTNESGRPLVLRKVYALFRTQTLGIKILHVM
ncbi:hypothetical protein GQ600_5832 [Phytophthora cactorum]|nr:hypothetical protein GQ600_5832 [Phytophthora cactorum]